jgi:hypothetical protein
MNHLIDTLESLERIIDIDLTPSIHLRDEKACLMRVKANIQELKFLIKNSLGELK